LIVRTHVLFELAPHVQQVAAGLGTATLLIAGLIALVQVDIKRVIAYSTMSQIGYMFLGAGIGAYSNAMFHLMTHAFFKALLFLGAGIVIHALAGEQDIRKMGGLRKLMPKTWCAMLAGGLALTGIPPFSGFFSKDSILAASLADGTYGKILFVAGLVGTFLTGVYTFRMLFVVFGGEPSAYVQEHPPHAEHGLVKWSMAIPVGVLTVLAVFGGWIQFAGVWDPTSDWLEPVAKPLVEATNSQEALASILAVGLGALGIGVAWWIYSAHRVAAPKSQPVLEHKFYFDELYDAVFYRPAVFLAHALARWVERPLVFGSVRELSEGIRGLGLDTSRLQTGLVRTYALAIAASLAVVTVVFVAVR
ncbi:MAG: proton-conducting transporter membrane subunit, partial [Gaiellaceae bacterium]